MRTFRQARPSPALVISVIALLVALGGSSYAAFRVPRNSVGTAQLRRGAVTAVKIRKGTLSGSRIAKATITGANINLSTLGTVPSAANAGNASALSGQPASSFQQTILWARVAPDGTLSTGNGAVSSGFLGTGEYEVIFNRAVTGCDYEATIGSSLVSNSVFNDNYQGEIYVEPREGNPNGVFVATFNKSGSAPANNAFHLAVIC